MPSHRHLLTVVGIAVGGVLVAPAVQSGSAHVAAAIAVSNARVYIDCSTVGVPQVAVDGTGDLKSNYPGPVVQRFQRADLTRVEVARSRTELCADVRTVAPPSGEEAFSLVVRSLKGQTAAEPNTTTALGVNFGRYRSTGHWIVALSYPRSSGRPVAAEVVQRGVNVSLVIARSELPTSFVPLDRFQWSVLSVVSTGSATSSDEVYDCAPNHDDLTYPPGTPRPHPRSTCEL